jgi:opacity protein-like surface antigen
MKNSITAIAIAMLALSSVNSANSYNRENKFYTHLDIGYALQHLPQNLSDSTAKYSGSVYSTSLKGDGKGYIGSGGIGFHLLNEFRLDLSVYYNAGLKAKKNATLSDVNINSKSKVDATGIFISGYYDIMTGSLVNPYVMFGMGVVRSQYKPRVNIFNSSTTSRQLGGKKALTGFAYRFSLGGSYHFAANLDIDFGYQLIHQGPLKANKKNKRKDYRVDYGSDLSVSSKREITHAVTTGIRYTF